MYITIVLNLVPFYLGASRGSIFALFIPFIYMMVAKSNATFILRSIFIGALATFLLYYIDLSIGSGFFDRLLGTTDAAASKSGSGARLYIWEEALEQFLQYPFFGDMLQTKNVDKYPHNIILEVLQALGFLGFLPLMLLFVRAFSVCGKIFRHHSQLAWVPVIFIQAFVQNMFSGAIYTASWMWTSMALLFAIKYYFKREEGIL